MSRRDQYNIVRNILEIFNNDGVEPRYRTSMNRTRIGYMSGLTYAQTNTYLKELMDLGLLVLNTSFKPYPHYKVTEKGRQCLQLLGELEDELRPDEGRY